MQLNCTANLRTKILDFRGFDLSRVLILWGGILMYVANFSWFLSQQTLAGIISVGRLGVCLTESPLHDVMLNCTSAILYYTILYYTILYYTILYYTILYYTILYYTILILY